MTYTIGYEIEFHIENKKIEQAYLSFITDHLKNNWGLDGGGFLVKEFRSRIFEGETPDVLWNISVLNICKTLSSIKTLSDNFNPIKIHGMQILSYGIHVSFGGDFLDTNKYLLKILKRLDLILFKNNPLLYLFRYFKVGRIRTHLERIEYRLIPLMNPIKFFNLFYMEMKNGS